MWNTGSLYRYQHLRDLSSLAIWMACLSVVTLQAIGQPTSQMREQAQNSMQIPAAAAARANAPVIEWSGGILTVTADNSSLRTILRAVSQRLGMRITGGVREERVFGVYGPGDPANVICNLLVGSGTNLLLTQGTDQAVTQLILTSRSGGPSPPELESLEDKEGNAPASQSSSERLRQLGAQHSYADADKQAPITGPSPLTASAAANSTDITTQRSPNGIKTPAEIYRQLQMLEARGKDTGIVNDHHIVDPQQQEKGGQAQPQGTPNN